MTAPELEAMRRELFRHAEMLRRNAEAKQEYESKGTK